MADDTHQSASITSPDEGRDVATQAWRCHVRSDALAFRASLPLAISLGAEEHHMPIGLVLRAWSAFTADSDSW